MTGTDCTQHGWETLGVQLGDPQEQASPNTTCRTQDSAAQTQYTTQTSSSQPTLPKDPSPASPHPYQPAHTSRDPTPTPSIYCTDPFLPDLCSLQTPTLPYITPASCLCSMDPLPPDLCTPPIPSCLVHVHHRSLLPCLAPAWSIRVCPPAQPTWDTGPGDDGDDGGQHTLLQLRFGIAEQGKAKQLLAQHALRGRGRDNAVGGVALIVTLHPAGKEVSRAAGAGITHGGAGGTHWGVCVCVCVSPWPVAHLTSSVWLWGGVGRAASRSRLFTSTAGVSVWGRDGCHRGVISGSRDSVPPLCQLHSPFWLWGSRAGSASLGCSPSSSGAVTPFTIFCCTEGGGVGGSEDGGVGGLLRLFWGEDSGVSTAGWPGIPGSGTGNDRGTTPPLTLVSSWE